MISSKAEHRPSDYRFARTQTNPGPIAPYQPIPWETFTLAEPPRSIRRRKFARVFITLCALMVVGGALMALSGWGI